MKLLVSILLFCFIASAIGARRKLDGTPACGTYTPASWINDGETASLTLQLGSPLSTEVGLPYFFGCTPDSAFSHKMNRTIFFSYLDSDSPNDKLVNASECDDVPVCGAYYMNYDDSEGSGNLAVITDAFFHPGGMQGGRVNVTYGYNNYQIGSLRARYDSVFDLIGEIDDSKVPKSSSSAQPTTLIAKLLRLAPYFSDDKTVVRTKIDFYYNNDGLVGQEIIKVNTTISDDFTKEIVNIRYRMDGSGEIIQVRDIPEGDLPSTQIDLTYDDNGQIIKVCQDGCESFRETFVYDPSGRLTEVKTNGTEYKFKYHSGQISTANFGDDFGEWTFNYDN
jgi:hypothetical protein